jgi:hypothetical protein
VNPWRTPPQNRLSAAGHGDLAIDRADVGLHRVRTEVVSVATSALLRPWVISAKISDSRSVSPSLRPGQFNPPMLRARKGGALITMLAAVDRFQRIDEVARR